MAYLEFFGQEDINIGLLALNDQTHALRCQGGKSRSCPFIISKFKICCLAQSLVKAELILSTVCLSHVSRADWGWGGFIYSPKNHTELYVWEGAYVWFVLVEETVKSSQQAATEGLGCAQPPSGLRVEIELTRAPVPQELSSEEQRP